MLRELAIRKENINHAQIISIQDQYIKKRNNINKSFLKFEEKYHFLKQISRNMDDAYIWYSLGLSALYEIFKDPHVTEAFCNTIDSPIIITHRKQGRCVTNITFKQEFWNALKLQCETETDRRLTFQAPALKAALRSPLGALRISIQMPPLTISSPAFNIRRLPDTPITMEKLVADEQIRIDHADYLLEKYQERKNIVVAGEPGSGKTTLANALLLQTDHSWRLIIMEDANEVSLSHPMLTHYKMSGVGDDNRFSKRTEEIARLLHRSPDYVFLGELQNAQDTTVAFEAFAAGVRGMATTHAANFRGLISRWINSHKLDDGLLGSIDIVVLTKRKLVGGKAILRVDSIYENTLNGFQEVNIDG